MSTASIREDVAPLPRMLAAQTLSELRIRWRNPAFSLTNLGLPLVFFTFFGLPVAHLSGPHGVSIGVFLIASFGAYAVGNIMVFAFGVGVAAERGMKADLLQRVSPAPSIIFLLAKGVAALAFALVALCLLIAYGIATADVTQTPAVWASVIIRLLVGSVPFIGLGLAIGYSADSSSAGGVATFIYLPLSFASGLFVPPQQLPHLVQAVTPYLPTYHYGQLAWGAVGAANEPLGSSVAWLAGYAVVFFVIAARSFRREEQRKFS